jgi:alpha-beta hydrolase superfamily lysophospholipase
VLKSEIGTFRNCAKGESFFRVWRPDSAPIRGVLVLVHGLGEHSGRYEHVGCYLAERGLVVYAADHQGHGRSEGRRGWVAEFSHLLDDLEAFHDFVANAHPGLPLVLLGHSMGGLIVTAYLLERKHRRPDLVVLSGPAIVPLLDPNDRTIDPSRLSKDPSVWEAYLGDPLILRERVDPELFVRLAEGIQLLPGRAHEIDMPLLLIHGDADRLCSAEGAAMYVRQVSSPDVEVRMYPGGRHEMFNELEKDEVLGDLWAWLDKRLP